MMRNRKRPRILTTVCRCAYFQLVSVVSVVPAVSAWSMFNVRRLRRRSTGLRAQTSHDTVRTVHSTQLIRRSLASRYSPDSIRCGVFV